MICAVGAHSKPNGTTRLERLMLQVKPTADMPRPGANPMKAKKKRTKKAKPLT